MWATEFADDVAWLVAAERGNQVAAERVAKERGGATQEDVHPLLRAPKL